ncbi:HAD family hydrolase [Streptomyces sp. NPDC088387]|uniref:HAD family hydrolase n=1 Tax=Streptomyces sp. NPDC088387 TaxID=3365859 RepID=UPI0038139C37
MTATAPPPGAATAGAAFFDVDETLLGFKSPASFWGAWSATPEGRRRNGAFEDLLARARAGAPRALVNREYFRLFEGVAVTAFERVAAEWYTAVRAGPHTAVLSAHAALRGHRAAGDLIVLVSGSVGPLLAGPARDFGADLVLCGRQLAEHGILTGEVAVPMIGAAKAAAVRRVIAGRRLDAARCHAYGDHASDLPMLECVGHPVAVGEDPELAARAGAFGWRVLSRATGPLETRPDPVTVPPGGIPRRRAVRAPVRAGR